MKHLLADLAALALAWGEGFMTRTPAILLGETGSGKEHFAHHISKLSGLALVVIDLGGINEDLVDSELFGHVKGAFTGSSHARRGRISAAGDESIILLDEVGKASLSVQSKLLRALDTGKVQRVGSDKRLSFHSPILLAASEDMSALVSAGNIYPDLWHRIGVRLEILPLRERIDEIWNLTQSFAAELKVDVDEGTRSLLEGYSWPGNIRQLKRLVETCSILDRRVTQARVLSVVAKKTIGSETILSLSTGATIAELVESWNVPRSTVINRLKRREDIERFKAGRAYKYRYKQQMFI
jgi:transcriptional regulator with GAF, ATPase, and Fis domain